MIPAGAFHASIARFFEPVAALLADPAVSEIMINGPAEIWAERGGRLTRTEHRFPDRAALEAALTNVAQYAGRPLDDERPILEAHLPDGSRLEAVLAPLAADGPIVAIRRFSRSTLTIERLVQLGSLTGQAARFLRKVVADGRNVVVSGGTGSGKTSLLGALSSFVPGGARVVVIEDTRELRLQQPHAVYLESRSADERGRGRITIRDLLRATLRLRPDRIVVGEVRGGEALDLVQAMNTGHAGSLTTVHANSPLGALHRIETLSLMADAGLPQRALRTQIAAAIEIVIQAERTADGSRRIARIAAVRGLTSDAEYRVTTILGRNRTGELVAPRPPRKERTHA